MIVNRKVTLVILVVLLSMVWACPSQQMKPFSEMSLKEKATWMMDIYIAEHDDYEVQAARTDLSKDEKEVLRAKKKIMVKVYPSIKAYTKYAETGVIPIEDLETIIIQNIDELLLLM